VEIGEKIKQLRIKIGLTQEELGNRCELTKGFISQVERDLTSPSIATLMDILEALGTTLKDFFNDNTNDKIVFLQDDVCERSDSELGHTIRWLIPNAQKNKMEPILISLNKGGRSPTHSAYEGEVFGYVLRGCARLWIGRHSFRVKNGGSFYYLANEAHFLENISAGCTEVLWITTPPNF
jgi:transcriptional regulator with XRE-family HTH domain